MKLSPILTAKPGFHIIETTERSQTASFTLEPGESSSRKPNVHDQSDQILVVLRGQLSAEIAGQTAVLREGDTVLVRAKTPHKFTNNGEERAITASIYAPPAYPG